PLWRGRLPPGEGRFRRGVGVAFGSWFQANDDRVQVTVEAGPDGIRVVTGAQDMGNGTRAMLASAVADGFGLASSQVEVDIGSSANGRGPMSSASRTTASLWPTARLATDRAMKALLDQL